ncbi:hypothetical protein [Roseibium aggregatum]|uniref:Uncharacterized protein n=1 Tax=Roseibium aggregatum TaxID=187304 RepID=A0A939EJG3_9HYPH|nr:hypothetical protein [Roseibium aggregatum]MBN9673433.1 hypothetical protein [Roseibium aggregatum]
MVWKIIETGRVGHRIGRVAGLSLALLCLGLSTVLAQTKTVQVKPDGVVELLKTEKGLEGTATVKYGRVKFVEDVNADDANVLLYFPPAQAGQFTDTVTYKLQGDTDTTDVTVRVQEDYGPWQSEEIYSESFKAVFILFILAVLVESGLQLLFRWRPYLRIFDTSSTNALIAFAFSFLLVHLFSLDVVTDLFNIYTQPTEIQPNFLPGYLLTAMIIAGGSAGVNRLLRTFGFRPIDLPEEVVGLKDDSIAWISVTLDRDKAEGPVDVLYGEEGKEKVIGTIPGNGDMNWLSSLFFRNKGRFPPSGGYAVDPGGPSCVVRLEAPGVTGEALDKAKWGPNPIGKRAVIDLKLKL